MSTTQFLQAIAAVALTAAASAALANDSDPVQTGGTSPMVVAMGESVGQAQSTTREFKSYSHGRHAAPHTPRSAAPLVASERPPRPPIAVVKSTTRPEATASRLGAGHMFPPRGFPKW